MTRLDRWMFLAIKALVVLAVIAWSCEKLTTPLPKDRWLRVSNPTEYIAHVIAVAGQDTVLNVYVERPHPGDDDPTFQVGDTLVIRVNQRYEPEP